jgi:hypothetical protein
MPQVREGKPPTDIVRPLPGDTGISNIVHGRVVGDKPTQGFREPPGTAEFDAAMGKSNTSTPADRPYLTDYMDTPKASKSSNVEVAPNPTPVLPASAAPVKDTRSLYGKRISRKTVDEPVSVSKNPAQLLTTSNNIPSSKIYSKSSPIKTAFPVNKTPDHAPASYITDGSAGTGSVPEFNGAYHSDVKDDVSLPKSAAPTENPVRPVPTNGEFIQFPESEDVVSRRRRQTNKRLV